MKPNTDKIWDSNYVDFSLSTIYSLLLSCFTLVRTKLEYASPVSNKIASTYAHKLELVQRKFAVYISLVSSLILLKILLVRLSFWSYILYKLEGFMLMFLFIHIIYDLFCPLIDINSLRVPSCIIRNFTQFSVTRKVALPLDVEQLQIWYAAISIYLVSKLNIWNIFHPSSTFHSC